MGVAELQGLGSSVPGCFDKAAHRHAFLQCSDIEPSRGTKVASVREGPAHFHWSVQSAGKPELVVARHSPQRNDGNARQLSVQLKGLVADDVRHAVEHTVQRVYGQAAQLYIVV